MHLSQGLTSEHLREKGKNKKEKKREKEKKGGRGNGEGWTPNPLTVKISHSLLQLPPSKESSACANTVQYSLITNSEILDWTICNLAAHPHKQAQVVEFKHPEAELCPGSNSFGTAA